VTDALKNAVAKLTNGEANAAQVSLVLGCAAAIRRLGEHLRRLAQIVGVCFQVSAEGEADSERICEQLSSLSTATVQQVVANELIGAGISQSQVSVVDYQADPNPRSFNPNLNAGEDLFAPQAGGISLGASPAWVLGFTAGAAKRAAEQQRLHVKREFQMNTPEGLAKSFVRWVPFRDTEAGDDFDMSQVLSLLYTTAFQAVRPRSQTFDKDLEELQLLCERHSVLSLAIHGGIVLKVTALHEPLYRRRLMMLWPDLRHGLQQLPTDSIMSYFGIHTAEYFVFLHEYATWLLLPAALGVAVQVLMCFSEEKVTEQRASHAFMIFMAVWSTVFIEHWKRCRSTLHHQHGARQDRAAEAECEAPADYSVDAERLARAFTEFPCKAQAPTAVVVDKESGLDGVFTLLRFLRIVVAMSCLAATISGVIFLLLRLGEVAERESDNILVQNAPVLLYLIVVTLMERLYTSQVGHLVRSERHVSFAEHLKSLMSKTLFFQLVNYLGWFLYVAFCMQDLEYLRSQLLMFMTVKQVVALAQELLIPVLRQRSRAEGSVPAAEAKMERRQEARTGCPTLRRMGTSAVLGDGTSLQEDVGRQLSLDKTDLCAEYQQLVVLFALTNSFAIAFPLGPLLALLHTFVSRKTDAYKFLNVNMLAPPSPADGIISDTWVEVLEALSIVSVMCNVAVLGISGDRWSAFSLILLEHGLLFFKAYLAWSVPDQPEWIRREDATFQELMRYQRLEDRPLRAEKLA
ncbi:unnamed protein product, partial [Effrenium voratum]